MGRELRRVPLGLEWPIGRVWFGFTLDAIHCPFCDGRDVVGVQFRWAFERDDSACPPRDYCPVCESKGGVHPRIEIPTGPGYQIWETVSEGSPVSPVFEAPEELAKWMAAQGNDMSITKGTKYDGWMRFIDSGWAPSLIIRPGTPDPIKSGVADLASRDPL